jgi:ankyrin repeat protein
MFRFLRIFYLSILSLCLAAPSYAESYSSAVDTAEFEIEVGNWLMNDWAKLGRMRALARVVGGELIIKVQELQLQSNGACEGNAEDCYLTSVSLLLTQDGSSSFSTLASTTPMKIDVPLASMRRWNLHGEQPEWRMKLPAKIASEGVTLRLELRSVNNHMVYPSHGNLLALQRALAQAAQLPDPCGQINSAELALRSHCNQRLQQLLSTERPSWLAQAARMLKNLWRKLSDEPAELSKPNDLLIAALKLQNYAAVPILLRAGANPNAREEEYGLRSAVNVAASANAIATLEILKQAGADLTQRSTNEQKQVVTPVSQALRRDSAPAIAWLLERGAALQTKDPSGWTTMHVAAYESATYSLPVLVKFGADINERTSAYRQQTVLATALQFATLDTVQAILQLGGDPKILDSQGKDACDWARFFKRGAAFEKLVCAPQQRGHALD